MKNKEGALSWGGLAKAYVFLLGKYWKKYLLFDVCLFLLLFESLVPPLLLGKIIDFFGGYKVGYSMSPFYIYIIILGVSYAVVSYFRLSMKKLLENLKSEIVCNLRLTGFERLMNFSVEWHDQQMVGEKTQKISNGIDGFLELTKIVEKIFAEALTTYIGIIVVFLFLKPAFIVFLVVYLAMFFANVIYFNVKIEKKVREQNIAQEKSSGSFVEGLNNLLTIKTLGAKDGFADQIAQKEELLKKNKLDVSKLVYDSWRVFQVINGFSYAFFLFLVGQSILAGDISAGMLVIFYGYLENLITVTAGLMDVYSRLVNDKTQIERMLPIYQTSSKVKSGQKNFPENWKNIVLTKANFKYRGSNKDKKQRELSNLNLEIPKYAKIGLVGQSGSGKSTLAKLLNGMYAFNSGKYQIGTENFYQLDEDEVKNEITLILQDSEMFNLSLLDNITLFRKFDPVRLQLAIEVAQLEPVINKLPEKLKTLIGEKGYHLSGGERQRIGIARAIYKNSQILIFDESTSSLDSKTESLVMKGLERRLEKNTVIFIAHKVASLKGVDKVIVMESGNIVEEGTYKELSNDKNSKFYKIYSTQLKK